MSTRRTYNEICRAVHHSKRLKGSSSAVSRRPSSELKNACIDDLPDLVLVEILCRLPCYKFVSQCKFVCKRWCTLMSDVCFIHRFLCLQNDDKQTPGVTHTLINSQGQEFLPRMSTSSKPLTLLFNELMSSHHLEEEPVVVDTYNDLVLCCASEYYQRDYYICNPYTIQSVRLPPAPQVYKYVALGFICDRLYYDCEKDEHRGHFVKVNSEYRCKVVRLVCPEDQRNTMSKKFKMQIFSSDTGEWRESAVLLSPSEFRFSAIDLNSFAYNGMLYWMGSYRYYGERFLIGLDPFLINKSKSSTTLSSTSSSSSTSSGDDSNDDNYRCYFIEFDKSKSYMLQCIGVSGGCLRLCDYDFPTRTVFVRDLNGDEMAMIHEGAGEVCPEHLVDEYTLDEEMPPDDPEEEVDMLTLTFDPNDGDIFYLWLRDQGIIKCNIRTSEWSRIVNEESQVNYRDIFFPLALPWWPTPVPILPRQRIRK